MQACAVRDLTSLGDVVDKTCESSKPPPVQLTAGTTRRFAVTFELQPTERPRDPLIEARSTLAVMAPALAELTVSRSLSDRRMWWPVRAALLAALGFVVFGMVGTRGAVNRDPAGSPALWRWATAKVFTSAPWTLKDSWATSIAAFGGLLGTVLGAAGFFTEALPGVSAGRFTGFSLVFGALAVFAPIVYTALSRRDSTLSISLGTVSGLLLAGAVTVAAVAGELATLGLLVQMSDAPSSFQALCFVGLGIVGVVVIVYAARSAAWLSRTPLPSTPGGPPREGPGEGLAMAPAMSPAPSGYAVEAAGVP